MRRLVLDEHSNYLNDVLHCRGCGPSVFFCFHFQVCFPLISTNSFFKKYWSNKGGEKSKRKWQLPQLLAGALIRTKLCFFQWTNMTSTEQRTFFFYSCQNIKWVQVLQECLQGWGQANADLFSSLYCVCKTPYVCLSICACVSTKPWLLFHVICLHARGAHQQFVFAPLWSFAVVENWSKSKWLLCYTEEAGGCLSRTRCKGPCGSWMKEAR